MTGWTEIESHPSQPQIAAIVETFQSLNNAVPPERSPISRILARLQRRSAADLAVLVTTRQRDLTMTSWDELLKQARTFGLGLLSLGMQRGQSIGILAPSGPEATIMVLGAMLVGIAVADLGDGTDPVTALENLRSASCRMAVCGTKEHAEWLVQAARQQCGERGVIGWGAASSVNGMYPFGQVCLKGTEFSDREPVAVASAIAAVSIDDLALVVPENRRDGSGREVLLTHGNCLASAESLRKSLGVKSTDRIVQLDRTRGLVDVVLLILLSVLSAASLVHDSNDLSPLSLCQATHPSVVLAEADILEVLQRELERELLVGAAWRRHLCRWAMRVGNEAARRRISGGELGPFLATSHLIADYLVLSEPRRMLGAQVRRLVIHGAGTRRLTRWFFETIGISPLGFFGVPASSGIGLLELPDDPRPGSYGRGMPGVDVWVDGEGRIRVRGANVSLSAMDAEDAGWLDLEIIGEIDDEGMIWPERALGALDTPSLAVLPIAEPAEHPSR